MARAPVLLVLAWLALAGCAPSKPPPELAGLWSGAPGGCAMEAGVEFRAGAIELVHKDQREVLFARPRYQVEEGGQNFRVRIAYDLPRGAGGGRGAGARGVLVLARQAEGGLAPTAHNLLDGRTGAARLRIGADAVTALMTLRPCGAHPWREGLRGRSRP